MRSFHALTSKNALDKAYKFTMKLYQLLTHIQWNYLNSSCEISRFHGDVYSSRGPLGCEAA